MIRILRFLSICSIPLALAMTPVRAASFCDYGGMSMKDTADKMKAKDRNLPNPRTAIILATIPGMGQIYNRDFWKVPIVYASLGGSIYACYLNSLKYQDFLKVYLSYYDLSTGNFAGGITAETRMQVIIRNLSNTKSNVKLLSLDQIIRTKDVWRRYRNVSILTTGIIYMLAIIEANVAAHLKTFDVSDDLSIQISPNLIQHGAKVFRPGFQVVFNFK